MIIYKNQIVKRIFAVLLCVFFIFFETAPVVIASEISGVNPTQQGGHNVYNINGEKFSGTTQFRYYDKFNLTQGDIANLIYAIGYDKFINLVNNQVSINGILNTMRGNNFFNGHAIFVSPNGVVIGASGVLNVGALSLITPSQDAFDVLKIKYDVGDLDSYTPNAQGYNNLINNSHGNVTINGKILSRGDVNIYADNITIEGTTSETDKTGIIAGMQNQDVVFDNYAAANTLFNNLVANNIVDTTDFALVDGKVKIVARGTESANSDNEGLTKSSVDIKNASIGGSNVEISASTELSDVFFEEGAAEVNVENSKIAANDVKITASTEAKTSANINLTPPVFWAWIAEDDADFLDFFSTDVWEGFDGTRSNANINIKNNSVINAINDSVISTNAVASTEINSDYVSSVMPYLFYAFGSKTNSKIDIEDTKINTGNDTNIKAFSSNNTAVSNNDEIILGVTLTTEDAYNFSISNISNIADTGISIKNSEITAKDVNLNSLASSVIAADTSHTTTVGDNDFATETKGANGAAFVAILNHDDIKSNITVENTEITATGDVNTNSVLVSDIFTDAIASSHMPEHEYPDPQPGQGFFGKLKGYLSKAYYWGKNKYQKYKQLNHIDLYNIYLNKSLIVEDHMANTVVSNANLEKPTFNADAAIVLNNNNHTNTINILDTSALGNLSMISAKDININSHTASLSRNAANAFAQGDVKWAAGISFVLNNHQNTTDAIVDLSTVNADNVIINAITELPGKSGTIGVSNMFLTLGIEFNNDSSDNWDFGLHDIFSSEIDQIIPVFSIFGFFNNFVKSAAKNTNKSIAAAIIVDTLTNNTNAKITNSTVNTNNDVVLNSVNSIVSRDGSGFWSVHDAYEYLEATKNMDEEIDVWTVSGIGATVVVNNYTNNANSEISKSIINATNGDVNIASANEQSYLNAMTIGAKADTLGFNGVVNVQNISGDTHAQIKENSTVNANNININSGKANAKLSKDGAKLNDDNQFELKDARDIDDRVSTYAILGSITTQENTPQQYSSTSGAIGVAVNVINIDRNVIAEIVNSTVTSVGDTSVLSSSLTKNLNIVVGATSAGGIKAAGAPGQANPGNMQNIVNQAMNNNIDDNGAANILDDLDEDENIVAAGQAAINAPNNQLSIAGCASVNVNVDKTITQSIIDYSTVNTSKDLNLTSTQSQLAIDVTGSGAKSGRIGVGAAVNVYDREGKVSSEIKNNSTINFNGETGNLNIDSNNATQVVDVTVGIGATNNSQNTWATAIGGSFDMNTVNTEINSIIDSSTINGNQNLNDITLNAGADVDLINVTGGAAISSGGGAGTGIGVGIASSNNNVKNNIKTSVNKSTIDDIKNLTLNSTTDNNVITVGIAVAIAGANPSATYQFDGAVGVDYIHDTINAEIINSAITASEDVDVSAKADSENFNLEGTGELSLGGNSGVGFGGDIFVSVYNEDITAQVDTKKKKISANDTNITAQSIDYTNSFLLGAAIAKKSTALVAANVGVNVNTNTVKSLLSGNIDAAGNVNVASQDETTLYTRAATLALSGSEATANVAGTVNIDVIRKDVNAYVTNADVEADGDVSVTAASINSIGGTKNSEGKYNRDDITSPTYVDTLLTKNSDGEYTGLKGDNDFINWNMFYDVSAASKANVAGALIIKTIKNDITAEITKSKIVADNLSVIADDYSVKNILVGAIPAFGKIAIGGSILYTTDESNIYALITNGSDINVAENTNIEAINNKDNIQVVAVAGGSEKASANISFSRNRNDDKTVAKTDRLKSDEKDTSSKNWKKAKDVKITSGNLTVNAVEDVNATHVTVTGGGAENIAIAVNPFINTYNSTIKSGIANTTVTNAAIDIDANNNTKTRDILIGLAGAGKGVAGVGIGLRNYYTDTVKAYIEKAIIDSTSDTGKNIDIASSSYINNSNWILSGDGVGQGVALVCNVLLNDLDSNVESSILNSDIKKANDISLTANKDKTDDILNVTGSLSFSGQGGYAEVNVIQTTSKGTANAVIKNTSIENSNSINIEAYNKKDINNTNIGIGGNFEGFAGTMAAVVNDIASMTIAEINANGKEISTTNNLNVNAQEELYLRNKMGVSGIGILSGTIAGNININNHNSLVSSAVKSATDGLISTGLINAGSADINSNTVFAMTNSDVAINTGLATIPVTIVLTNIGTRFNILGDEELQKAGVYDAIAAENNLQKQITQRDIELTGETTAQRGTLATVSGNLNANNDINIGARGKIKGYNGDEFSLTNVNVGIQGLEAVAPTIYSTDIKSLTEAKIDSGTVKSTAGDINLDSESGLKADYTLVKAKVTASTLFQGNYAYLTNQAETNSIIKNATLEATNVNVNAKTDTTSDISQTFAGIQGTNFVSFTKNENENKEKVSAIVTGDNVNITTTNDLNIITTSNHHITTTLYDAEIRAGNIADIMRNYAILSNVSQAIIDATAGEINVGNDLTIATLSPNGVKAEAYLYDIKAIDLVSFANPMKSEANVSSVFAAGIGNLIYDKTNKTYSNSVVGVSINTNVATNIYSGIKSLDDDTALDSLAFSRFYGMENFSAFNTTTYTDYAFNDMTNYAMLSSADHRANNVNIKSVSNKTAKTQPTETDPIVVLDFGSIDVQTKVTGKNTINVSGKNNIATTTGIELTDNSTAESVYKGVKINVVGGSDSGFETSVESDNNINLSGDYIANATTIKSDINRTAKSDSSFTEISIVGSGKTVKAHNLSKGSSTINIDGLNSDKDLIRENSISIISDSINNNVISTKIFDLGLIFTGSGNESESAFDTSNTINIKNTNLDINGNFSIATSNQNIADSSLDTQGTVGLIAIWNEATSENKLNASDIINFENSNIIAKNIDIQTSAFAGTKKDKAVEAVVHSVVGVFLVSQLDVKNTVTETSEINLKGTKFTAFNDINLTTDTGSYINQEAETKAEVGILSYAKNTNKVYITNNNNLTLDSDSKIIAANSANINMNTSNDVKVHSYSDATNLGGDSKANAEIHLTSNKNVDNRGSIEAGSSVNVRFDKTSDNSLNQHAEAYAYGVGVSSDSDGGIWYDLNNRLNVASGADMTSGKNILIDYIVGDLSTRTDNYSETNFLWCIPVSDHAVNEDIHINTGKQKMTLDGIVQAGQGNQRYLKIGRDGKVEESIGFYPGDYEVVEAETISGDERKQQLINKYENEKERLEGTYAKDETQRDDYVAQKDENTATINEISDAIEPWEDAPVTTESNLMASLALISSTEYDSIMSGMVEYSSVASYFKSSIYTDSGLNFTDTQKDALSQDPSSQAYKDAFNALTQQQQMDFRASYRTFTDSLTFADYIDSRIDLDSAKKMNLKNAYNTLNEHKHYVELLDKPKAFLVYENGEQKYIIANNQINPITPYQDKVNELNNENAELVAKISSLNATLNLISQGIYNYTLKIQETESTIFPDEEISKATYYFKNIESIDDAKIEVKGISNTDIDGTGNFISSTPGLKVDNYSSYDLNFKDVNLNSFGNGLYIDNKSYNDYLDQPQSVNKNGGSTDGVHYKSDKAISPEKVIAGIKINNFYDNNHPFASAFDIPNPTLVSNILLDGTVSTDDSLDIWNESGSIEIKSSDYNVPNSVNLLSTNGNVLVNIGSHANSPTQFILNPDNLIFAASGVTINADTVDIKGDIKSGYSERKITITDAMLENLIYDAASDENNLINLGGNPISPYLNDATSCGNLKAIYKDGKIYLYIIPDHGSDSSITITKSNGGASNGSITGNLTVADGYKDIEIINSTTKDLIVKDINNTKFTGNISAENIDTANGTKTIISKDSASTTISSDGNLTLDGVINNNVKRALLNNNVTYIPDNTGGVLTVNTNGKSYITINQQVNSEEIIDSILAGGSIDIKAVKGSIDILGNITSKYDDINISILNEVQPQHGFITKFSNLTISGDINNDKGDINITQVNSGKLTINSVIHEIEGNVNITNTNSGNILLNEIITVDNGDINIINEGAANIFQRDQLSATNINVYNSHGAIYVYSDIIVDEDATFINNAGDLIIGKDGPEEEGYDFTIFGTRHGNIFLGNENGNLILRENAAIANLSGNENNEFGISIINLKDTDAKGMYLDGYILNTGGGNIDIVNEGQEEAVIGGIIDNYTGNVNISNATESLTLQGKINAPNGSINIENSGNKDLRLEKTSEINAKNNISLENSNGGNLIIEGQVLSETGDISLQNTGSNIAIGLADSDHENYIKTEIGDVIINQINGSLVNGIVDPAVGSNDQNYDIGNPNPSYKTLISTGKDLIINIVDGDIGFAAADAATTTNASSRDFTNSINVNVGGTITLTAKNTNSDDTRIINLRTKESDMNIKKIDADGDVILTAADWKQADNPEGSMNPEYYKGYSVINSANAGDYTITAQNVSIISSNEIGQENNKLTVLQDKIGNADSTLNVFAEKSIYFDGTSNDANKALSIGTMRTKSEGSIIDIDLSSDTIIDTIIAGGSVDVREKAKNLTINTLSMYGNGDVPGYDTNEDILYPHDRLDGNAGGNGRIVLKALDAFANGGSDSSIVVNEAYILGLGLNDSDVELKGDNILFNAISKSDASDKPIVFDIQGVSQADVETVAGATRTDYKTGGGHYLADNAVVNVDTDKNNNNGLVINTIYSNDATVQTNNTNLTVQDGFIGEYGTFVNGNASTSRYNHTAVVNNRTNNLVPAQVQMFTEYTGNFNLGMDGTSVITTNAPVVYYIPKLVVNAYHSENSFTRLTLKENIDQQMAKDIPNRIVPQEVSPLKAIPVKLDTSNIIINEINNNISNEYSTEEYTNISVYNEENKNLSLNTDKEENIEG